MENKDKLTPKAQARYDKLIEAAAEVFCEQGYEKANMSEIVRRAGGSLATLYKLFGNKENLFSQMLKNKTTEIFSNVDKNLCCSEGKIEEFLYSFGKSFLEMIVTEQAVYFQRLIIAEGHRDDAKLAKLFFTYAMGPTTQTVAKYLQKEKDKGYIDIEDTTLAAHQFIHALKDPLLYRRVLGLEIDLSNEALQKALKQTVSIFVNGIKKK